MHVEGPMIDFGGSWKAETSEVSWLKIAPCEWSRNILRKQPQHVPKPVTSHFISISTIWQHLVNWWNTFHVTYLLSLVLLSLIIRLRDLSSNFFIFSHKSTLSPSVVLIRLQPPPTGSLWNSANQAANQKKKKAPLSVRISRKYKPSVSVRHRSGEPLVGLAK